MASGVGQKTPGSATPSDKTDMGKVKRIAAGPVDEGKDSKPNIPNMNK